MTIEIASVRSEFDIFAHRPIQSSVLETIETSNKPIAPADQNELEFLVPGDNDSYIDLDIKLFVRGTLVSGRGKDVYHSNHTGVTNNFLHSLFSHCNIKLNDVKVTRARKHYHYRSYLETLLTYSVDTAISHLLNTYWYLDIGETKLCYPTAEILTTMTTRGYITRWNKLNARKEIQLFRRLHSAICKVPLYLLPGVRLQIRLTKAKSTFYLMNKNGETKTTFKFLDAQLLVRRVRLNPAILIAHT
jgi:RNase P subunit RPR2